MATISCLHRRIEDTAPSSPQKLENNDSKSPKDSIRKINPTSLLDSTRLDLTTRERERENDGLVVVIVIVVLSANALERCRMVDIGLQCNSSTFV
jgi:hypothetical protein